ncbi:uncharacterized protein LOC105762121 [Gossypium raimondii]|nr:uncharacterized protein LOC105762121 [Gossypium raimondii]
MNLPIFQGISWSFIETIKSSMCWAKQYFSTHKRDLSNHIEAVHDSSMIGNWIHLFIDGAVKLDAGFATSGEIACKQEGEWIIGFNHYLRLCSVFDAKLWVVLDGFTLTHERGCQKVVIHIDNLEVVKAIQIAHLADSFSALLRRIHMSYKLYNIGR